MLYVIGIGPGNPEYQTEEAGRALAACDLIVGYPVYLEFVKKQFPEKEYYATPMTREIERCRYALAQARERQVALICSGDAGVYGMAGPVLELAPEYPETGIRVIPGVTAALGGAAVLGAPLMHDFALISLSDRLTPMEEICRKLKNAAESDFVIVLYNPSSKKRHDYLRMACDILLTCLAPSTVCGYVRNIGRDEPRSGILSLEELKSFEADMFTTVFIGNSRTKVVDGRMVTPRGYEKKIGNTGNVPEMNGIEKARESRPDFQEKARQSCPDFQEKARQSCPDFQEKARQSHPDFQERARRSRPDSQENREGAFASSDERKNSGEILVAAGTTEGRRLCEFFAARGQAVHAFVATDYGEEMLPDSPYIFVETGRKNADEMLAFIRAHGIRTCYDAMHPYATLAHRNMKEACERGGCAYTRVLRERDDERNGEISPILTDEEKKSESMICVASIHEASEFLKRQTGNILVTTGSRELMPFMEIAHYEERIWVRVLPSVEALEACHRAGIPGKQIIAMHGPFSKEMNELILREHHIRWLVTKDSGKAGGFAQKLEAARAAGAGVVLVQRPQEDEGITLEQLVKRLEREKRGCAW